jgi:hypothetical protein
MAHVQFDEESSYTSVSRTTKRSFLVRLVFKTGLVSTDRQAEYVLLAVAAFFGILAIVFPSILLGPKVKVSDEQEANGLFVPDASSQINRAP